MTDQPSPLIPFQAFDHQRLQKAQATNLQWCEAWGKSLPPVNGVAIGLALTYDLIGLLNRAEIEAVLGDDPRKTLMEAEIKRRIEAEKLALQPTQVVVKGKRRRLKKPKNG